MQTVFQASGRRRRPRLSVLTPEISAFGLSAADDHRFCLLAARALGVDGDGFFYYVDRKKDAIRRRGENISSFELEVVLNSDDRVAECAAIAEPSELGEDDVKMVVVPAAGIALTAPDVWDLCEKRMPKFWVPRYIEFRESLPKTPNQKVQKYLLRKGVDQGPVFDREARDG